MEYEYKEIKPLEEGKHFGEVTRVVERHATEENPYDYTDVFIRSDEGVELKYGCPSRLTNNSRLGKLLANFAELESGKKYDLEELLIGQRVRFMTINSEKPNGTFAEVVDGSVKKFEEKEGA